MAEKQTLTCDRCNVVMEEREVQFGYLGKAFRHKVKRCPVCGQVYLPEDLVAGRMNEVETLMEDK